jgi:uncharacterized protein YcaQ
MRSLSHPQARRLAVAAQGLHRRRPASVGEGRLRRLVEELSVLQLDSVNVVARAHYLPVFSRFGGYQRAGFDALAYRPVPRRRVLFEYWGHEASLLPVALQPLFRWRMQRARERYATWGPVARLARERPDYIATVLAEVAARGPIGAGELERAGERRSGAWGWNWRDGKVALEWLFWIGEVTAADRPNFVRRYDLTERVLPADVLAAPTPDPVEAQRALLLLAARALGVATAGDLADYFRLPATEAADRVRELAAAGALEEVSVSGWRVPAYLLPGTGPPPPARGAALLCPFDPLVWDRRRLRRLFHFDYRVEIYVPAEQRRHGYYVFPFLLGDSLVARVDLKADRRAGALLVRGAWAEPEVEVARTAAALAAELTALAGWLGLGAVDVAAAGDLSSALAAAVSGSRRSASARAHVARRGRPATAGAGGC